MGSHVKVDRFPVMNINIREYHLLMALLCIKYDMDEMAKYHLKLSYEKE